MLCIKMICDLNNKGNFDLQGQMPLKTKNKPFCAIRCYFSGCDCIHRHQYVVFLLLQYKIHHTQFSSLRDHSMLGRYYVFVKIVYKTL